MVVNGLNFLIDKKKLKTFSFSQSPPLSAEGVKTKKEGQQVLKPVLKVKSEKSENSVKIPKVLVGMDKYVYYSAV